MITTVKSTPGANWLLWDVLLPLALCCLQRNTRSEQTEEQESIITRQALSRECIFPVVIYSIVFRFASLFQVMLFQWLFSKNKYSMKSLLMDPCRQSLTPGHRSSWQTHSQAIISTWQASIFAHTPLARPSAWALGFQQHGWGTLGSQVEMSQPCAWVYQQWGPGLGSSIQMMVLPNSVQRLNPALDIQNYRII